MRMARSTPIARAARICSSTDGAPIVTPTISVASPRSRIRNASSMAISSKGLITDLDAEAASPANVASLGSGTLLNGTRIFIDRQALHHSPNIDATMLRWISLVPEYSLLAIASRNSRSTSYSVMYP